MAFQGNKFRFDNYVVGSANRLAVAAARAVAEGPGTVYNPLVIYGSSGLGKTHLLSAIAAHAMHLSPELTVEQLTMEDFVAQLRDAVQSGQLDMFTSRYQAAHLLLLDDIQFVTGQRETQNELLRLFNALQGAGRQIVMASDRAPQDIPDVDERLVTRLAGGLTVDIAAPDFETRMAILEAKVRDRGATVEREALEALATREVSSVRELQGLLTRLLAERELLAAGGDSPMPPRVAPVNARLTPKAGTPVVAPRESGEFDQFVSRLSATVEREMEPWRARLTAAAAHYAGEGMVVAVLERALRLPEAPDVDGLLTTFHGAVQHLRQLERQALALDPTLGASLMFRDPEKIREAEALVDRLLAGTTPPPAPDPKFTRDGFDVGTSNQLALRSADVVAAEPGGSYNPLVIVGPPGVGKTHLLHAIGNELWRASEGTLRIACIAAPAFSEELIFALRDDTVARWRARYRSADVLLFDDVHFLAGKERTQEELFHLLNVFRDLGKQVVVTSEVLPAAVARLEERIRTRLEEGLTTEVQLPDPPLRAKLVARFFAALNEEPDGDVIAALAAADGLSGRDLRARVAAVHRSAVESGSAVSAELVQRMLDPQPAAPAVPTVGQANGADPFFLNAEKVVWEWPDVGGRLIEELR